MANVDYERCFKELVKQIKLKRMLAEERLKTTAYCADRTSYRGLIFAYQDIENLARKMEMEGMDFDEVI